MEGGRVWWMEGMVVSVEDIPWDIVHRWRQGEERDGLVVNPMPC